jgi:hypothetical protein
MKKLNCGIYVLFSLMIINLSVSAFYFNKLDKKKVILEVKLDNLREVEQKLDSLYHESKARDSIIYRTLLEIQGKEAILETI